ncbi:SDR family oxidoreductase [Jatrophihabitans sp. YIM 134969]
MHIVIAGGHGQIARHLERLLADRGDTAVGIIRSPGQEPDLVRAGASAVVLDLESSSADELAPHLAGADAVVFAAGAGPNSGIARKDTVDRAAAVLLADAAVAAGVRRYVLISSMGAGSPPPPGTDEVFAAYLEAKTAAEDDVRVRSALQTTILRPGGLTDDPPTGTVTLAPTVARGQVTRADVAAVVLALLDTPATAGLTLELTGGDVAIGDAVWGLTVAP